MLKFNANGKFKIIQLADIQENAFTSPDTLDFIDAAVKSESPDLVVFTGDQIKGYGLSLAFGDKKKKFTRIIEKILRPLVESETPFALAFGNHDESKGVPKSYQLGVYENSGLLVGEMLSDKAGCADAAVPIFSADGRKQLFGVFVLDSCPEVGGKQQRYVTSEQLDAYTAIRDRWKEENGKYIPSLVFQHVPVPEVYELFDEVEKGSRDALRGAKPYSDRYYVLSDRVEDGGFMHENAAIPEYNSGELDALSEKGDVLGLYFGHDHINSFVGKVKGVDLGYTQGCGFNCYGPGLDRAGRVFEIDETCPEKYTTRTVTYSSLLGKSPRRPLTEYLYTHSPSSVSTAVPFFAKRLAVVSAAVTTVIILKKALTSRR